MKHWESYLKKERGLFTRDVYPVDFNADVIVVIPCYNEPNLFITLESLLNCSKSELNILIAIIVNSGENSDLDTILQNRKTHEEIKLFSKKTNDQGFLFTSILCEKLPKKHAGVGLARRIGMNLAVQHFLNNENREGIIISLDADCTVSENYFTSICQEYNKNVKLISTVQNVYHRVEGDSVKLENAIRQYELYLKYYSEGLRFIEFPYYYPTIGSSFSVTANAYVKSGGMGRQQGGEDFYFLQKIFPLGEVKYLNNTFVRPLARFSDRVPFGTGPSLQKIIEEPDSTLKVYSVQSFIELKRLIDLKDVFYKKKINELEILIEVLHPAVRHFIHDFKLLDKINDCNNNSRTLENFRKRFFHHLNAFLIIKYMNLAHPVYFKLEPIHTVIDKFQLNL